MMISQALADELRAEWESHTGREKRAMSPKDFGDLLAKGMRLAKVEGAREAVERIREWANDNVWTDASGHVVFAEALYRELRRAEDRWSMRCMEAADRFGLDSPQEREALERATDYAVEIDMLLDEEAAR